MASRKSTQRMKTEQRVPSVSVAKCTWSCCAPVPSASSYSDHKRGAAGAGSPGSRSPPPAAHPPALHRSPQCRGHHMVALTKPSRKSSSYGGCVQAPRGAHARAAAPRRVPERLRALPVRPQHPGRSGSPGAGDMCVHGPDHSPECRRRGRLRPLLSTEHAVSLGGPTCAGRPPPVRCTLLRLAEHVRLLRRGRPRARRATRRRRRAG